jgi:hypothetical protein
VCGYRPVPRGKYSLADLELAVHDVQRLGRSQEDGTGVRMAVGPFFGKGLKRAGLTVVMPIRALGGCPSFQEILEVVQEQRLVLVHYDGRRGVPRVYVDEPIRDAGPANSFPYQLGQVDELLVFFGTQVNQVTRES